MRMPVLLLVAVLAPAFQASGQTPNGACPSRDTVYTIAPADSGQGFKLASPAAIRTPPPEFHGGAQVNMVITAEGNVVADSTKVLGAASERDSSALARAVRSYRFRPATLRGCQVSSWYSMTFRRK